MGSFTSLELTVEQSGHRLDRWLAGQLPQLSRSRLQQLIADQQVQVNEKTGCHKNHKLQVGDRLLITIPPPQPLDLIAEAIPLDILYEDECLIIVNKPAGLVVHPSAGHPQGTLVNALLAHCPHLAGIGGIQRPGIVHRLDKDTTGALVVAKTEAALHHLQAQLKAKTAQRLYWGIVHGSPQQDRGTVDLPLGRHPGDRLKRGVVALDKGGRTAVTHWQVRERWGNYSWWEFRLETGRTHQIRVHAKELGHPLLGDRLYSNGQAPVNLLGQALHAYRLTLIHPLSGEELAVTAPPPPSFNKLLAFLQQRFQKFCKTSSLECFPLSSPKGPKIPLH